MDVKNFNFVVGNERQERLFKAKMALNKLTLDKVAKKLGYSVPYIHMNITGKRYNKKVIGYFNRLPGINKLEV